MTSRDLQNAKDMLLAMQAQRDQAMNGLVMAQAEIMALRREIEALRAAQASKQATDPASGE